MAAADARGTVVSAWTVYDGTNYRLEARVRPPGGTFSAAQYLSAPGANAQEPDVAFDSQGNAIAVWSWYDGTNNRIQWAMMPAGGSFGAAQYVSPSGENADLPKLTFDSLGNAVVLWRGSVVSGSGPVAETMRLRYAVRPPGGSFGAAQQLETASTTDASQEMVYFFASRLVPDANGNVFAAWSFTDDTSSSPSCFSTPCVATSIKSSMLPAGGSFSAPVTLDTGNTSGPPPANEVDSEVVAADPQGDALVIWDRHNGSTEEVVGKIRPAGGTFEGSAETVSGNGQQPQVALDAHGNAIAVFDGPINGKTIVQAAERPAGGGFGIPQPISALGVQASSPTVAFTSGGDAVAAWLELGSTDVVKAAEQPAGGSFGTPVSISASGLGFMPPSAISDGQGDVVASWDRYDSTVNNYYAELAPYDGASPVLQSLGIPGQGTVGSPLAFSVNPVGIWSPVTSTTWAFGDGATANGMSVSHVFGAVGAYPVMVTATDAVGNSSTAGATSQISPHSTGGGGPSPATKATISALGETNSIFTVGRSSTPLSAQTAAKRHKRGTVFRFRLDQSATVKIAVTTKKPGRRVRRRCVAATRRLRHKPRCTRTIKIVTLVRSAHAGLNKVPFSGRIRGRALKPGHYQATFTAIDSAGRSAPRTLRFTIVRR